MKDATEEEFQTEASEIDTSEEKLLDAKEEVFMHVKEMIEELSPDSIYKYSDYIEPIKISFKSNSIVYPLKISQISTRVPEDFKESPKTNEVLLYVLNEKQVKAPGFSLEFNKEINKAELDNFEKNFSSDGLGSLKKILGDNGYYLTKLRRDFAKAEMDEDLYLIEGETKEEENLKVYFFTGENCPHCGKAKNFLNSIESAFSEVDFVEYEVYHNQKNRELYDNMAQKLNISSKGVPLIVVGETDYVLGFSSEDTSGVEIVDKIKNQITKKLSESYAEKSNYTEIKNKVVGFALADRLKGKIILKVEDDGKAYYINPSTKYSYFLGRPADAFSVMRDQGIGITNFDLNKIPVGLISLGGQDSDNDGLSDMLEEAIGTDKNNSDTDGDGYSDKDELEGNYNPNQTGGVKLNIDNNFSEKQKGKILLQVENNGEAWYVNPEDGKKYFLGRPVDAFSAMRNLGLGISNKDFGKL